MNKTWRTDRKYHLVKVIEHDGESLVVYKYWRRRRQSWVYVCKEKWLVEHEIGIYKDLRSRG